MHCSLHFREDKATKWFLASIGTFKARTIYRMQFAPGLEIINGLLKAVEFNNPYVPFAH